MMSLEVYQGRLGNSALRQNFLWPQVGKLNDEPRGLQHENEEVGNEATRLALKRRQDTLHEHQQAQKTELV